MSAPFRALWLSYPDKASLSGYLDVSPFVTSFPWQRTRCQCCILSLLSRHSLHVTMGPHDKNKQHINLLLFLRKMTTVTIFQCNMPKCSSFVQKSISNIHFSFILFQYFYYFYLMHHSSFKIQWLEKQIFLSVLNLVSFSICLKSNPHVTIIVIFLFKTL